MVEIQKKMFVSPVEAFQIVGQESFGSNWNDACINDEDSELRQIALKNLRLALQSGYVQALRHDFDYERPLTAIDAAGEYFKIDLERNCINLSFFAGQPIQARIHVDDLRAFIRNNLDATPAPIIRDETECSRWIVARIRNGERVKPKALLWAEAKREFPNLSERAFNRAREVANEKTGADLHKGGRPKHKPAA